MRARISKAQIKQIGKVIEAVGFWNPILIDENGMVLAGHGRRDAAKLLGRTRSNVWTYPGVNYFGAGRLKHLAAHPTVKPVALVADAMRDCATKGDPVLDLFMGSGTTLLAAEKIGRRAVGLECDPAYVDVAIRR